MMEAIRDWYTDLEYFSSTPTVKYNKLYKVSSISTKACSIFVLISYWTLVFFKLKEWLYEESFTTGFSMSVRPKLDFVTVNKKYVDFSVAALDMDKKIYSLGDATSIDNINGNGEKTVIGEMFYPFSESSVLSSNLQSDMKLGGDLFKSTEKSFYATTSFSILTPEEDQKNKKIHFTLDYATYFLNENSPKSDFGSENSQKIFDLSIEHDYSMKLKFSKVNVAYKDGILFSLGVERTEAYEVLKEVQITEMPKESKGKCKITLDFDIMNEQMNYKIEYEEFDSVLAKISGIYGFVMGIMTKIVGFFNQGIYEAYVGKCCYNLIRDQIEDELPTINSANSENAVEEINPRPKPEIKASFLDSFRIYCYAAPRDEPFCSVFSMVEHEIDVVEVVRRNMYLSAIRKKLINEFPLVEDGRDLTLEDPVKTAEKENSPKEWCINQVN